VPSGFGTATADFAALSLSALACDEQSEKEHQRYSEPGGHGHFAALGGQPGAQLVGMQQAHVGVVVVGRFENEVCENFIRKHEKINIGNVICT